MRFPGTTGRSLLAAGLAAALLLCASPGDSRVRVWAGENPGRTAGVEPQALERLLCSPLAADRTTAERLAVAQGDRARPWARAWTRNEAERLRSAGWGVLAQVGREEDLRAGLRALADAQPGVQGSAAEAVVALATHLPAPSEPWIPAGALPSHFRGPLALALARRLEATVGDGLPPCIFTLGEGLVPALHFLCVHPRMSPGVRDGALRALGALGGVPARRALASVAGLSRLTERGAWWRALLEVGSGPGLEPVHQKVEQMARQAIERGAYRPSRPVPAPAGLSRLTRSLFYRFLATCPPPDVQGHVGDFLLGRLAASAGRREPVRQTLAVDIVRAFLVVCTPDADALQLAVRCTSRAWGRRSSAREGLGNILVALEAYREDPSLQEALEELLSQDAELPRSVTAWGHYLGHSRPAETLRVMAVELLAVDGGAATLAQRRLGARLADRVGGVPPRVRTALLSDPDPWLRTWALGRAAREKAGGALAPEVVQTALAGGLEDVSDTVFLVAAELADPDPEAATRRRVLRLAVRGSRSLRVRAWRVLQLWLAARPRDRLREDPGLDGAAAGAWLPPSGGAALDRRIRAAADYRRRTGE